MKNTFRELTLEEFETFADECPSKNYMQSPAMYNRYQKIGRECYLLGLLNGDKVVVAGIASVIYERFGQKIFTFSRGPLTMDAKNTKPFTDFLDNCKTFLKSKHGMVLQISPNILVDEAPKDFTSALKQHHFKDLGEYEQVKWTYALPFDKIENLPKAVPGEPDEAAEQILLRSFRKDHRYTIRYATERYNINVRKLDVSEYNILLKMIEESGKVHGFVPRDLKFFEQLADAFQDDVVAMVAELPDGTPIAAAFFILYGDEIIYLSSGLSREHKKLGGPHLIQWTMIKYAYEHGYKKYNFWGTNPDPENGVFKFKQGFHGEIEEFVGTFAAGLSPLGKIYLNKLHYAKQRDL
ncbi:peptidoglycan bridge formation glycyltransferase FemA/FemB family protein [Candidatus Saccharibacteria bacterium]|nr:peptidoglycan bridge formation glycyltransferase FemA/FemB family protein [Candidatus Saccharibacteria bacterium]MBR3332484.1 peptidoglycan bridge formation glycyltransferase FemA/FemB family protein [Candidatus Saccharibacteria bacterium]